MKFQNNHTSTKSYPLKSLARAQLETSLETVMNDILTSASWKYIIHVCSSTICKLFSMDELLDRRPAGFRCKQEIYQLRQCVLMRKIHNKSPQHVCLAAPVFQEFGLILSHHTMFHWHRRRHCGSSPITINFSKRNKKVFAFPSATWFGSLDIASNTSDSWAWETKGTYARNN